MVERENLPSHAILAPSSRAMQGLAVRVLGLLADVAMSDEKSVLGTISRLVGK
jgi:hypothetical protein